MAYGASVETLQGLEAFREGMKMESTPIMAARLATFLAANLVRGHPFITFA